MSHPLRLLPLLAAACATPGAPPAERGSLPEQIVTASDRDPKDRELDPQRRPAETLAFFGVRPGMTVAELGAGGGYTTELLARAVGTAGTVYSQNSPTWGPADLEKAWQPRAARPVNQRVVRVLRDWEDPLPPEAKDLDAVYVVCAYHDVPAEKHDTGRMNQAVFEALKPGGVYALIDNSAKAGTGAAGAEKLHRIDEAYLRAEVEKAGFRFDNGADFLRNAQDDREWAIWPPNNPRAHTQDRFALRFVKPR